MPPEFADGHGEEGHIEFRSMKLDDIDAICEIEREAFPTPWTHEAFYNELRNNHFARYLVMVYNGQLAGYAGMWLIMDEAHITNIAIHKNFRGKRLGEKLLRQLQATAYLQGMKQMTLEVRVSNTVALKLYEKLGFNGVGLRRGYYTDNNEDALIMWADLDGSKKKSRVSSDEKS
jgi:ribosomal-protein-alanine N-acetyltransferase